MKKILLVILLSTLGFKASAQEKDNEQIDNFGKIELGFHGLSFGYELPISNKFVWENAIGAGMGMNVAFGPEVSSGPTRFLLGSSFRGFLLMRLWSRPFEIARPLLFPEVDET